LYNTELPPDVFCTVSEAAARVFDAHAKLSMVTDALVARWGAAQGDDTTIDLVREQRLVVNGLVGLARVRAAAAEKLCVSLRQELTVSTGRFGAAIQGIWAELGDMAVRREDLKEMVGFIYAEAMLFTEIAFKDCGDVLGLYAAMPPELKPAEALRLTEVLLKTEIAPEIVQGIHDTVLAPTEAMVADGLDQYSEHAECLARALHALARNYFPAMTPDDVAFLMASLAQSNQTVVLETIKAIDACIEKADLKLMGGERESFFREVLFKLIVALLCSICDASHQFCYPEIVALLRKLFDLIGSGKVRCRLFEGVDNNEPAAEFLSHAIVESFPLVAPGEMTDLFGLLLMPRTEESFEELIAQFMARAKQTTPGETLRHLRKQKIKEIIAD
jgi:hypothetical protein